MRSPEVSLLLGMVYAAVFSLRLPERLSARELFPVVMLFLFLIILASSPPRLFTISLIYTVRALLTFRAMIITLQLIQNSKNGTDKQTFAWVVGLAIEFMCSAILVYSTFRPVAPSILEADQFVAGGLLMVLSTVLMPYWIPGVILGALSFYEPARFWAIIGFALLAAYESNFSKRPRNAPARVLS